MDERLIEAAVDEGFPYAWAAHHLNAYKTESESLTFAGFVAYLHEIEALRTLEHAHG